MDYVLEELEDGRRQVIRAGNLRDFLTGVLQNLIPDFTLPECVTVKLDELSDDLMKLTLKFPASAYEEAAGLACDLYEAFAYLFGKGFHDVKHDGRDETMVWYLPKQQRVFGSTLFSRMKGETL